MNIAIICARKNSKRIKNKNFIKVGGIPLINYTIDAAVNSKIFNRIIINTDNKKYTYSKQGIYNLWVGTYKKGIKKIKNEFYTN